MVLKVDQTTIRNILIISTHFSLQQTVSKKINFSPKMRISAWKIFKIKPTFFCRTFCSSTGKIDNKFNFRNYRWSHRWFKSTGRRTSRKNPNSKWNSKFNIGTSSRSTSIILTLKQLESVKFNRRWIYSTRWRWRTRTTTWTGYITGTCDRFDTRNTSIRVNFGTINQSISKFTPLF